MKLENWKSFLNPHTLKGNLIKASMYIAAFELLKDSIINHPKTFFTDGFNKDGLIINENYQKKVLSRNKSPLYASLDWLKDIGAMTEHDIDIFNKLKDELANSIFQGIDENDYFQLFSDLIELFERIEKWWILNFEFAIDPDINIDQIDEDSVQSGAVVMLDIVFSNNEEDSWKYYKALMNEMG
jgi:hypothetical protein